MPIQNVFSSLSDDVVLNIFNNLQDDPRHWPRLACVCTRFSSLVRDCCYKNNCSHTIPSDLISATDGGGDGDGDGLASLHKITVCCPGLRHAGLLLDDTSDFGLYRDLGPEHAITFTPSPHISPNYTNDVVSDSNCWSLFDDLYYDTVYNPSEFEPNDNDSPEQQQSHEVVVIRKGVDSDSYKKTKLRGSWSSHLASGTWNLSREQGSKLLARQFRDDCLYVSDLPGCVHVEEKRNYRLFRGAFRDFKRTRVWRTINDGNRKKLDLGCAFCSCEETWDLHSAFCLRRGFGYHDDGEPVVRAFVCENGHVSGAWTDVPIGCKDGGRGTLTINRDERYPSEFRLWSVRESRFGQHP